MTMETIVLAKSVFLFCPIDPDLKKSQGSLIVCLSALQLMATSRIFYFLAMVVSFIHLQKDTFVFRQCIPIYATCMLWLSALYKQYLKVIGTMSLNQMERKPLLMHKTEFFQIEMKDHFQSTHL